MTVITAPGDATANSYVSTADADAFFVNHLYGSDWTNALQAKKEAAVIYATNVLDNWIEFTGSISSDAQRLRWPRTGVVDYDNRSVDDNIIPEFLEFATAEMARSLLATDRMNDYDTAGFEQIEVGSVNLVIDARDRSPRIPDAAFAYLRPYGTKIGESNSPGYVHLVRG